MQLKPWIFEEGCTHNRCNKLFYGNAEDRWSHCREITMPGSGVDKKVWKRKVDRCDTICFVLFFVFSFIVFFSQIIGKFLWSGVESLIMAQMFSVSMCRLMWQMSTVGFI